MAFFRKSRGDVFPPLDTSLTRNNLDEVHATIDHLGIPKEQFVVVGSAALTLLELDRRAHDLDLVVHEDILADAAEHLPDDITATLAPSSRPGLPHLHVTTQPLPSELLPCRDGLDIIHHSDIGFDEYIKRTPPLTTPDGIQIIKPFTLLHHKQQKRISEDRLQKTMQDHYDVALLEHHLDRERTIRS